VCLHHGIPAERVLGGTRTRLCSVVRWQTIVLAREFTCASFPDIAEVLELSYGTTFTNALHQHNQRMADAASPYARSFKAIKNELESNP
jgi:chromosomal replication initiation ATPase DnaA